MISRRLRGTWRGWCEIPDCYLVIGCIRQTPIPRSHAILIRVVKRAVKYKHGGRNRDHSITTGADAWNQISAPIILRLQCVEASV